MIIKTVANRNKRHFHANDRAAVRFARKKIIIDIASALAIFCVFSLAQMVVA